MSRRVQLRRRLGLLEEIGSIMEAMKNIAAIETHKLARFVAHQHRVVASIEAAARDFLGHHPEFMETHSRAVGVIVAIGSQRGFCGDFNESVASAVRQYRDRTPGATRTLVVGHRLAARLAGQPGVFGCIDAPGVAEEVQSVQQRVMEELRKLESGIAGSAPVDVVLIAHREGADTPEPRRILPQILKSTRPRHAFPPRLNVSRAAFFTGLVEHYVWAQLQDAFYGSFMAENRRRLQHLEGAMKRMEQKSRTLRRRYDTLRQEEITQEIEVILLSGDALNNASRTGRELRST